MKKLITLLAFVLVVTADCYSQTTTRKYEYAIVHNYGTGKQIFIDYGNNSIESFKEVMKNKYNNTDFSIVDAFNYLDEQGYELISTYMEQSRAEVFCIFRREIKNK